MRLPESVERISADQDDLEAILTDVISLRAAVRCRCRDLPGFVELRSTRCVELTCSVARFLSGKQP